MISLTIHNLAFCVCVFWIIIDGGHFTNLSLSGLNDETETFDFPNTRLYEEKLQTFTSNRKVQTFIPDEKLQKVTTDGKLKTSTTDGKVQTFMSDEKLQTFTPNEKLQTSTTDGHSFARSTQHVRKLLNISSNHPSSSLSNISQAHEPWKQFTSKADDFVKTPRAQILSRLSQAGDRPSTYVTHLQQEKFSTIRQLVDRNIGMATQSPVNQGRSARTYDISHTPVSPEATVFEVDQSTSRSTQLTQDFTVTTQISVTASETTVVSFPSKENDHHSCQPIELFVRILKLCENRYSGDLSRSCKGRCGQVLSFDHSFDNCSCDEKCVVYNDCCIDFYTYCNHTFQQSLLKFGEKIYSYESSPHLDGLRAITFCSNIKHTNNHSTSKIPTVPTATSSTNTPSLGRGHLQDLFFYNTLVADLSDGLVYQDVYSYYSCNSESDPEPYIIPFVLPLRGQYIDGQTIESYVFPEEFFQYSPYILDPFPTLRNSFHEETVECGSCRPQTVNYLCGGINREDNLPSLKARSFTFTASGPLHQIGNCFHWPSSRGGLAYWNHYDRALQTTQFEQLTPYSWTAARQRLETLSPDVVGTVTIRRQLHETNLDLEFTGAPWARMSCTDVFMSLDDCQVLQCSQGYHLTENGKCWLPKSILMTMEAFDTDMTTSGQRRPSFDFICQCVTIYKIFKTLQIYDLGRVSFNNGECRLHVTGVYDFDNLYSNNSQQVSRRTVDNTLNKDMLENTNHGSGHLFNHKKKSENTNDDLNKITNFKMALLKGLIEHRNDCDEIFLNLRVCFVGRVRNSELSCVSYTYDNIYVDVSKSRAVAPQHHTHQCHRELQLHYIVAILMVTYCVMS